MIFSILLLAGLPGAADAQSDATRVTLFHDTHLHGQLEGAASGVVSPIVEGRIAALGDVPASP